MYSFVKVADIHTLIGIKRLYSFARKSHYDVLNLNRNCTSKDIKEAFIRKSKEYHPDKNKDAAAQQKFVEVLEAYNVLSKPGRRAQYDNMTEVGGSTGVYTYRPQSSYSYHQTPHYEFYKERPQYAGFNDSKQQTYKMPNYMIIMICVGFAFTGLVVQLFVIRETFKSNQHKANEKSKKIGEELAKIRATALQNGNELQTQLLLDKIVAGANSSTATAALGHALAKDDK